MNVNQLRHCYCGCRDYRPTIIPPLLKGTELHPLKEVLSWQDVWQHCMSVYCKPSGVRFNKIWVSRVKKQITLEVAYVNMLENERKAVKKSLRKVQVIFDVKIFKVFSCVLTVFMCLLHGGSWITIHIFFSHIISQSDCRILPQERKITWCHKTSKQQSPKTWWTQCLCKSAQPKEK